MGKVAPIFIDTPHSSAIAQLFRTREDARAYIAASHFKLGKRSYSDVGASVSLVQAERSSAVNSC